MGITYRDRINYIWVEWKGLVRGIRASLVAQTVKNPPAMQETWFRSLGREDPLENGVATHFGILAGKPHGEWSLVGCSPWGRKES